MNHFSSFNPQDYVNDYKVHNKINQNCNYIKQLFEKKFNFQKNDKWKLPNVTELFKDNIYQFDKLQEFKLQLNTCKSKLNDYPIEGWSQHTRRRNPAGEITWKIKNELNCEFVTQAWCKIYECFNAFDIIPTNYGNFNSLHLCEAPGAFITALNHYLQLNREGIQWDWCATTLNPYHEGNPLSNTITDDRFMLHTLENWEFGADLTGDILNDSNVRKLEQRCQNIGDIHLITADGSINCFDDPEHQEENVSFLHLAETATALKILCNGGNFVLKMFTFFEHSSVNLLYLLIMSFEKIVVFKPATSKCGNSEIYVICLNYFKEKNYENYFEKIYSNLNLRNIEKALFPLLEIPKDFLEQVENCSKFFMDLQLNVIESNIVSFNRDMKANKKLHQMKQEVWEEYIRRNKLKEIPNYKKLLYGKNVLQKNFNHRTHSGSFSDRCAFKNLTEDDKIIALQNDLYDLQLKYMNQLEFNKIHDFKFQKIEKFNEFSEFLYVGKQIVKVVGSKFVIIPILCFYLDVLNYYKNTNKNLINNPTFYEFHETKTELNLKITVKNFFLIENYGNFEKEIILQLIEKLLLKESEINFVCFENLPILTHFLVSCFYFMGNFIYESMQFYPMGGKILFLQKRKNSNEILMKFLNLLKKYYNCNEDNDKNLLSIDLLCFINITNLYENQFYDRILQFNQCLCLNYCNECLMK